MKPKIKIQTEKTITVEEWDRVVEKVYGKPYSYQQQDGCKQRGRELLCVYGDMKEPFNFTKNTIPEIVNGKAMGVSFKAWLARDPKQPLVNDRETISDKWQVELWWQRNFYPSVEMIAQDLHKRGIIEPGEYHIIIDW